MPMENQVAIKIPIKHTVENGTGPSSAPDRGMSGTRRDEGRRGGGGRGRENGARTLRIAAENDGGGGTRRTRRTLTSPFDPV